MGAIYTILVNEYGSLSGTNTDGFGFKLNIKSPLPEWDIGNSPVAVLGGGGAARAIVASLVEAEVPEIWLVNQTLSRAEELTASIGGLIAIYGWVEANDYLYGASMVINTTSLGMFGQPDMHIDLSALEADAIVTDIVYTPFITLILAPAQVLSLRTVDGLGMLLHKASRGFEGWFQCKHDASPKLRAHILTKLIK
jgi:shikimate dehydrogenase